MGAIAADNQGMHTATLNLTLLQANDDLRVSLRYLKLPRWVMRGFSTLLGSLAARQLRRLASRLSRDVLSVEELARMVGAVPDETPEMIDPEFRLAASFEAMLASTRDLHRAVLSLAHLVEGWSGATRLHEAALQFAAVCGEYYTATNRLAWAIGEHDASRAQRLDGYVATTPEEVAALLERIAAEA